MTSNICRSEDLSFATYLIYDVKYLSFATYLINDVKYLSLSIYLINDVKYLSFGTSLINDVKYLSLVFSLLKHIQFTISAYWAGDSVKSPPAEIFRSLFAIPQNLNMIQGPTQLTLAPYFATF